MRVIKDTQVIKEVDKLKIVRQVEEVQEITLNQIQSQINTEEANIKMFEARLAESRVRLDELKDLLKVVVKEV